MISIKRFQTFILSWYRKHGRHNLPWRKTRDPYRILVSEIMLQQTQVDRVIPLYRRFLKTFPSLSSLALARAGQVIRAWQGLGYNRRALFLKKTAEAILRDSHGRFPRQRAALESLPGVGPYTARAVSVFAFNTPEVFIETNVRRVFLHFFFSHRHPEPRIGVRGRLDSARLVESRQGSRKKNKKIFREYTQEKVSDVELMPFIQRTLYWRNPREWYSALMDYGALELKKIPNPNTRSKHYLRQSTFEGSNRQIRGKILSFLSSHSTLTFSRLKQEIPDARLEKNVEALIREGFLGRKKDTIFLS